MSHCNAKLELARAQTLEERARAVACALEQGMLLGEIEEYLDFVDAARAEQCPDNPVRDASFAHSLLRLFRHRPQADQ
jgi:hypothetical protein